MTSSSSSSTPSIEIGSILPGRSKTSGNTGRIALWIGLATAVIVGIGVVVALA